MGGEEDGYLLFFYSEAINSLKKYCGFVFPKKKYPSPLPPLSPLTISFPLLPAAPSSPKWTERHLIFSFWAIVCGQKYIVVFLLLFLLLLFLIVFIRFLCFHIWFIKEVVVFLFLQPHATTRNDRFLQPLNAFCMIWKH